MHGTMVNINPFKKKERAVFPKSNAREGSTKQSLPSPPSPPREKQTERGIKSSPPKDRNERIKAPVRSLQKEIVKSDRDLYNDLLEEATFTQHTCSTSNSSLEFDGNNSSRFSIDLEIPDIASISPSKSNKKVIVDAQQQSRPRSPGHTGHERRQKFTFVGEMLDDEDVDGIDEFGEEVSMDFSSAKTSLPVLTGSAKPNAVRPVPAKKVASKPKKKTSAATRCEAV